MKFEEKGVDNFGHTIVECPVCEFEYKKEGILKHIHQMAKNGDVAHRLILEEINKTI